MLNHINKFMVELLKAVLVLCIGCHLVLVSPAPTCSEPSSSEFEDILKPHLMDEYESASDIEPHVTQLGSGNLENDNREIKASDNHCPANLMEVPNSNTKTGIERSTCPIYSIITRDPRRYPMYISEKRCKCQMCLEKNGTSESNACEKMYVNMVVLEKTECVNGVWQYVPRNYKKQVGCFCARRPEMESASQVTATTTTTSYARPPL